MTTPAPRAPSSTAHDLAFMNTVLKLHGVAGAPSQDQLDTALASLVQYRIKVRSAPRQILGADSWLKNRLPEQAAAERAFLFVRFGSVIKTTDVQRKAFYSWLCSQSEKRKLTIFPDG